MNLDRAKLIHNKFSNFLYCNSIAFIAPSEPEQLKLFLELAGNHQGTHKSFVELLIDISETDKIFKENFSNSDFEIYVSKGQVGNFLNCQRVFKIKRLRILFAFDFAAW